MVINFTVSSFPTDYCFTSANQFAVDLVTRLAGEVAGDANFFNDGDTTPAPDDQDRPWLPHNYSGSNPPAFVYQFIDGAWRMPHPLPPGAVMMYEGTEASITTYNGGEVGTVTATTGPMWEKVSAMDARFPIGPGTLASGALINVGDTGGTEEVELLEKNIPIHVMNGYVVDPNANLATKGILSDDDRGNTAHEIDRFGGDPTTDLTVPHSNMPPYKGIWFIRRTARLYFRR